MNNIATLLFLFLFSITAFSQEIKHSETALIKDVMEMQELSWNKGDIESFMSGYWKSDSILFIGSKGPTYGWHKTLSNYQNSYPNKEKMGQLSFGYIKIELIDKSNAYVIGTWELNRKEDTLQGHFSLIWKKIEGSWKIIADHSS